MGNEVTRVENSVKDYSVGMTEVESRQLAEVKGKMVLAKQFPRDPQVALKRILVECENMKLAEAAVYSYPRGGQEVKGPSIRLAEVIASHWGNFTCGVTELEQRHGESTVKAYAWDLETNYSDEKVFTVKHIREKKTGNQKLTDPRDIYELVANQGARRKRACIFSVIPTYLIESAVEACEQVVERNVEGGNIEEARTKMLNAFQKLDENITKEALERKIGKEFDKFGSKDIVRLKHLYAAIKDGFVKASAAFDFGQPEAPTVSEADQSAIDAANDLFSGTPFGDESDGGDNAETNE